MEEEPHTGKPDSDSLVAPKRRFRWVYFIARAAGLLLCLCLIGWFFILPRLVENQLLDALEELGFDQVSLHVESVGLGETRVINIRLGGKDSITIGKIITRYKLGEVISGQLRSVDIERLGLKALVGTNGMRFPPLENFSLPESDETMDRLPFKEISIRSAKLFLEGLGSVEHIIPVEAKLTRLEPKTMAVKLYSEEKGAALTANVSIGGEAVEVADGSLTLECQELPVPGLGKPLHDVLLKLNFAGKISTENISLVLKTGSDVSARLRELSFGDSIDASGIRVAGKIVEPLSLESNMDDFKTEVLEGQVQGRLEAQTVNWQKGEMRLGARALKTAIGASKDGLVFALQKGTELDWTPGDEFLSSRGMSAKNLKVTIHKLDKPAQLHVMNTGSWSVNFTKAKIEVRSGAVSNNEGNFTCESINANLNIQASATADNFSVNLLSAARVSTGKIQYETFKNAGQLEIGQTHWSLSAHEENPVVSWSSDGRIDFNGRVLTKHLAVEQSSWKLSARPLDLVLATNESGKELSDWRNTHLEFRPAVEWLNEKGIKAHSLVLIADKIPTLKIPQGEKLEEWSLAKSNIQLTAEAKSIKLMEAAVEADYIKVPMSLEIAFDEAGLDLDLEKQAKIMAQGIRFEREGQVVQVEAGEWDLSKNRNKPLIHLDTKSAALNVNSQVNGKGVKITGNVVNMGPVLEIQMPIEIRNKKIEFNIKCMLAEEVKVNVEGKINDKNQRYTIEIPSSPKTGAVLVGMIPALRDLNLPSRLGVNIAVTNNVTDPALWNFGVSDLAIGSDTIPPITGELRLTNVGQEFSASCELIDELMAQIKGNRTEEKQNYTLRIPPTNISDKTALGNIFYKLKGIEIGGTIGLKANIDGSDSQAQLFMKDISLASSALSAIVEGLSGTIRINDIGSFTTADAQQITVNSARLGNLELVNGLAIFRLKSGEIIVEEKSWSLKQDRKGRFVARNFELVPGQSVKPNIEVQNLDLGIWLSLLTDGQVSASGKLSGLVPVILNEKGAKWPVRLGDGAFLETQKSGKLQFRSAKWAQEWLESVDPRFRTDPALGELRQNVVEALQDFSYSSIKFNYDQKTDNMRVAVRGEGKTRQGRVVKFDPTINIKPVASWVNEVYNVQVILAHLENLVDRDLDNLFGD